MKTLIFLVASILLIQFASAQTDAVTEKKCENFLPQATCDNLRKVASLLHEKATIVQEAVKAAVAKHITKASEMLTFIKGYLAEKLQCEKVLTVAVCDQLNALGQKVKLTTLQIKLAIETAVASGATKAKDIYKKAVAFMTTEITCAKIFGQTACDNMKQAMQKFHEQVQLLNEAIMAAAQKQYKTTADLLKNVKNTIVSKVQNFTCTDVLTQSQCDFIGNVAKKFKLSAKQVTLLIAQAVVSGAKTAKQIYDVTIGELIESAKNVQCEDLISKDTCDKLDAFAKNLHLKVQDVTDAVKVAIANGKDKASAIYQAVREYLAEKISCDNFFPSGSTFCTKIENLAKKLHINFHKVVEKLRSWAASGITKISEIRKKIIAYIWNLFWGGDFKRSVDYSITDTIAQKIMELVEKAITISKDVKDKLKTEIKKLIADGKVKLGQLKQVIKDLIAKYGPQSDEQASDVRKSLIEQLKEALKKAHGKAKELIKKLLAKSKEQLEKIKEYVKKVLNRGESDDALDMTHDILSDMAYEALDDEVKAAEEHVNNLFL